jgi:WD40 repeat protein
MGACLVSLQGHTEGVYRVLALADGRILSCAGDGSLRMWDGQSGACLAVMQGSDLWVDGVLELADGRVLLWSRWLKGNVSVLSIWDGRSGSRPTLLEGHRDVVCGAVELPAKKSVLSWARDGSMRLWDDLLGVCLATLHGHTRRVNGVRVLRDGRVLSWSEDGTLRLWEADRGACLATMKGHTGDVHGALVLSDGRLLSWSEDGTLRLWDGQTGACLDGVLEDEAPTRHPEWLHARAGACNSVCVAHDFFLSSSARTSRLRHKSSAGLLAAWNADSNANALYLWPNGTAVVTQDNGEVCILKLHHGKRRISLAEAEELLSREGRIKKSE